MQTHINIYLFLFIYEQDTLLKVVLQSTDYFWII